MPIAGTLGSLTQQGGYQSISAADRQPQTQFDTYIFPAGQHTIHGRGRHHVHEFPHTPGGAPEKLGRGLYNITIRALFHDRFLAYPGLYPDTMNAIRRLFETQATKILIHPSLGSIPAFIVDWRQVKDARVRSGEAVDIEFLEDSPAQFVTADSFFQQSQNSLDAKRSQLAYQFAAVAGQVKKDGAIDAGDVTVPSNDVTIFGAIDAMIGSVLAARDTATSFGNSLSSKVNQLISLCQTADQSAVCLGDPRSFLLLDSLHDVWSIATSMSQDLQNKRDLLRIWVVPQTMSMAQVAATLYQGDSSRQSDLIALNGVSAPNPLSVKAGTSITYYP